MATKRYNFKFHCIKDADVIQRLEQQDNMQDYIRLLIKSDILADSFKLQLKFDKTWKETARQDYYNRECNALNDNNDGEFCRQCVHGAYDYDKKPICTIEEDFAKYWEGVVDHVSKN